MDPLLFGLLLAPLVLLVAATGKQTAKGVRRKRLDDLHLIASAMGLEAELTPAGQELRMVGERNGLGLVAEVPLIGGGGFVELRPPGLPEDLGLQWGVGGNQGLPWNDHQLGDAHFDSVFSVLGNRTDALAYFDSDTRGALIRANGNDGFSLSGGGLRVDLTAPDSTWFRKNLASIEPAAQLLSDDRSHPERLLQSFKEDAAEGFALACGEELFDVFSGSKEAREATLAFLHFPGERFSANTRARDPYARLVARVYAREPKKSEAFVERWIREDYNPSLHSNEQRVGNLGLELAASLGAHPGTAGRRLLWELIKRGTSQTKIHAVGSLGRIGELSDVEPLRDLPGILQLSLAGHVEAAIKLIQDSHGGGARGGLAVVDPTEGVGNLSVVSGGGELSKTETDEED